MIFHKIILIILLFIISSCTASKINKTHGTIGIEEKFSLLKLNINNSNDVISLLGPPSTKSKFDENLWIYIERKKGNKSIFKLGKEKYIANNVLVLKINSKGLLQDKKIYKLDNMKNDFKFSDDITKISYKNNSFVYNLLSTIKQRINAPTQRARSKKK
tara:strand:- start:1412 stop:1888 length:477 start_codon:yes stop_codon:yes gene_type:complete